MTTPTVLEEGCAWTSDQVGDDYVLSAVATGLILDVITGDGY